MSPEQASLFKDKAVERMTEPASIRVRVGDDGAGEPGIARV
jgi:hypothetical protein